MQVAKDNPGASSKVLMDARRAFKLKAGLKALKKKSRDEKDFPRSLSLSAGNKGRTGNSTDAKNKDASPLLLHLGTAKKTASPSLRAEPKSDAPLQWKNSLSLTDEERATVYDETRVANRDADAKAFALFEVQTCLVGSGCQEKGQQSRRQLKRSGSLFSFWNRWRRKK